MRKTPVKSFALELVQSRTGREPEELLRELYVQKRHTLTEIGDALGVSRETVRGWLVDFGIGRDDRGPVVIEAA